MEVSENCIETVYRAIKRSCPPDYVIFDAEGNAEISPALFKDENGVSVSKQMRRTKDEVILHLQKKLINKNGQTRLKGAVNLSEKVILDAKAILVSVETSADKYHAEIHKNRNERLLSNLQMLQLADSCKLCHWDDSVENTYS